MALPEPERRRTGTARPHARLPRTAGPRAAATRVARFWRRELDDPLSILAARAEDSFPRTRLEALLGLSYLESEPAALAALKTLDQQTDYYLDYVLGETLDTLEDFWLPALESDREPPLLDSLAPSEAGYLLSRLSTRKLERLPAHSLVDRAVLRRADAGVERQRQALTSLTSGERGSRFIRETPAMLLAGELAELDGDRPADPERFDRIVLHLMEQDAPSLLAAPQRVRSPGPERRPAAHAKRRHRRVDHRRRRPVTGQRAAPPPDRRPVDLLAARHRRPVAGAPGRGLH